MTFLFSSLRRLGAPWNRAWKGLWLMAVAAVHTIFAVLAFQPQWHEIARRGVFDSVGSDPMLGAVVWFGLFGIVLALLGWAIVLLERGNATGFQAPQALGWGVLALTLAGIVLMPVSGFWLALPPALALCRTSR